MTLACENANLTLVEIVTVAVADVDDEDHVGKSLLQTWILVEILKLGLVKILNFKFSGDDVRLRFLVDALSRFWRCDQDLCLNLWYDFKKLVWQDELNPRVRCAFGNV